MSLLLMHLVSARTCMWAEQLIFNDSCKGQAVKEVGEHLPYASTAVFAQAFLIEAVHLFAAAPLG